MAGEKRSIEISYKADLKDLINKLKTLPDVTSAEAKKMVANLDKQVKKAEKAAEKSAKATKKAAETTAKAARNAGKDFNQLRDGASKAAAKLDNMADSAGDADQGFSAIALGLKQINPALGEAAEKAADFSSVAEGMWKGFRSMNPWIIAAAAAVAALTYAYTSMTASAEEAKQQILSYRDAVKSLNSEQIALKENLEGAGDIYRSQIIDYLELTGKINEYSAALMRSQIGIKQQYAGQLAQADEIIKNRNDDLILIKRLMAGEMALTEESRERLKTLQILYTQEKNWKMDLADTATRMGMQEKAQLSIIQAALLERLKEEQGNRDKILVMQRKSLVMAEDLNRLKEEYAKEQEEENKRQARLNAQKDDQLGTEDQIVDALAEAQALAAMQLEMAGKLLEMRGTETEKIIARYDEEFKRMGELAIATRDFETFKQISQALYEDRAEEFHDLEMKRIQQRNAAVMDGAKMLVSSVDTFATASIEYLKNTDKATEESMQKLHKLKQAAAVANIAIGLAEAYARAATMGPVAGGILAVAATAAAGAQTAAVLSQPPPTLHMGGMAPDERSTVLTGESVLDRTTTRRLGEEGVRGLQNRTRDPGGEVIVLQPFKHFDRYNRSARRRAGRRAGSGGY